MKVIVLMAGLGSRFKTKVDKNPKYNLPKPLIPIKGKPMVYYATSSLPFIKHQGQNNPKTEFIIRSSDLIFIALKSHQNDFDIKSQLNRLYGVGYELILLDHVTRGNAETALAAEKFVKPKEEVLILDSDNFYNGQNLYQAILDCRKQTFFSAMFPVFTPRDKEPKWCFVLHKPNGEVIKVSEKDPLLMAQGASAMIGAFYFVSAKLFFQQIKKMIEKNNLSGPESKQEFYLSQIYNHLLQRNHKIKAVLVTDMWGLGTPTDLEYFISNYLPSKKN